MSRAGAVASLAALLTSGCYVSRQGVAQMQILLDARPVREVLHDPAVPPDIRRKLRIVRAAQRFGVDTLGMAQATDLYRTWYDTGDGPIAWNVSASARDRFEARTWWFPVVGVVPYLGFFDEAESRAMAEALEVQEDLDVLRREVGAFSTLGWFDDPVFTSALRGDDFDVARLVLHEMAHAEVFFPGHVAWNENFATLVGDRAALQFLIERYGKRSGPVVRARRRLRDERVLRSTLDGVLANLEALYEGPGSRADKLLAREKIFVQGKATLVALGDVSGARRWAARPWNNALWMSLRRYRGRQSGLAKLLDERFSGDLAAFIRWLRDRSDPPGEGAG